MSKETSGYAARPDAAKIEAVRGAIVAWFEENRRDLPWRRTRDPYSVLVSEVMLQQIQVKRAIPFYLAFLERFPTVEALAAAPLSEAIRCGATSAATGALSACTGRRASWSRSTVAGSPRTRPRSRSSPASARTRPVP